MLAVLLIFTFNSLVFAENAVKALDKDSFGVAINGYDSVAYFTEGKAVKGNEKYSLIKCDKFNQPGSIRLIIKPGSD
jgi:hypothetical protein